MTLLKKSQGSAVVEYAPIAKMLSSTAGSGLLTFTGGLTGASSARMSGIMASLDGGVLVYGELRI